jgi:hypothetical protein
MRSLLYIDPMIGSPRYEVIPSVMAGYLKPDAIHNYEVIFIFASRDP